MCNLFEIKCDGCEEVMITGPGDTINYFMDKEKLLKDLDEAGKALDSFKFICSTCNKKTDPAQIRLVKVMGRSKEGQILFYEATEEDHNLFATCRICGEKSGVCDFGVDLEPEFSEDDFEITHICNNCKS